MSTLTFALSARAQGSLFQIFNALVRAGAGPREAVLAYFARAIALNARRAGTHVDPVTVASDSFMMNLQSVLLRFAEPFMDSQYTKVRALPVHGGRAGWRLSGIRA